VDNSDDLEANRHASAAREHVYGFNRATMWEREQTPSATSDQLAEFADLVGALPQAFSQLSSTLEHAAADQVLSMDTVTDESDPAMAIGVARLHLEEARGVAVELHKHLDAARNATAHIISQGVDNGQESMPWDRRLLGNVVDHAAASARESAGIASEITDNARRRLSGQGRDAVPSGWPPAPRSPSR